MLEGIVTEDVEAGDSISTGNQYVWIPVGDKIYINEQKDFKKIELGRYSFDVIENSQEGTVTGTGKATLEQSAKNYTDVVSIKEYHQELASSDYGNVGAKNLKEFIDSVNNNGGYYIGRFEAGDSQATSARGSDKKNDISSNPVIKKDKWPYTFITQSQAAELARNMYDANQNFVSDLVNSYAWDTAIIYIITFGNDDDYAKQNRLQTTLTTTGDSHDENNNYDVRCNIYDMAGNAREFSTEASINENAPINFRGGNNSVASNFAGDRDCNNANYAPSYISFRSIIYL